MEANAYANLFDYAVKCDVKNNIFKFMYGNRGAVVEAAVEGIYCKGVKIADLADYNKKSIERSYQMDSVTLTVLFEEGSQKLSDFSIDFIVDHKGIKVLKRGDIDIRFDGKLLWGEDMENSTFAMCFDRDSQDLRTALGPATSTVDNALLDRLSGEALCLDGGEQLRLRFDWSEGAYRFCVNTGENGFEIHIKSNIYKERYGVEYKAINKNSTFSKPPAGWMTWYAVKFDACEKVVLENATFQSKHLKDYGADTVWVDWEWYHRDLLGVRDDGADSFNPDKKMYPNGLAHVSSEIKKLGLVPALWVGFTNDPSENEFIKENKDALLAQTPQWCGQYFLDISNPKFLDEYIPKTFKQVSEWGYEALKWDCLPITLKLHDEYRQNMYDKSITVKDAYRNAIKAARKVVGEDFYMLSCSGERSVDILYAADLFDAARIGGDIFKWDEFIKECIEKVIKFYPLHNVLLYNDPDNVVLREEFNTYNQAVSRACFVSLLGLPITLGDVLPELPAERVELLKRTLPTIDAHPMDIRETTHDLKVMKTNLAVEKPFESWNVAGILNLTDEPVNIELNLIDDLHLEEGEYLVYDYWKNKFIGEIEKSTKIELQPCETKVLSVRKKLNRPQIISTSRHITQGAVDIKSMMWNEKNLTLSGVSSVVDGNIYEVVLYVPKEYKIILDADLIIDNKCENVQSFVINPKETGNISWSVTFQKWKLKEN